jgi:hypothetical protein
VTNRSRARWSLAVALAAHGAAIAWTMTRPVRVSAPDGLRAQPIEVEVATEPTPPAPEPLPEPATPGAVAPPQAAAVRVAPRTETAPGAPSAPESADTSAAPIAADPGGAATWSFSPTTSAPAAPVHPSTASPVDGALATATAVGVAGVLAEAEKKAASRARKPFKLTPKDLSLGIVPGGQYASVARDRVRNSLTPLNGHALLEFWTDSHGVVARVRVLNASSDPRAWDELAGELAEDARSSFPLKIPSDADGLIVTVDVTSAMKTLSGSSASQGTLAKALGTLMDPADAILDSKASPQRIVAAKVVGVEAF